MNSSGKLRELQKYLIIFTQCTVLDNYNYFHIKNIEE